METAPCKISLLPDSLANQIAAGEVVERPASVVKELLENSLDAGATRIDARLDNGGQSLIRVQDNGHGIEADQLELAVTRHATSKIGKSEDLENISSYGFRGEALPSIASVSRFRLASRSASARGRNEAGAWIEYNHGNRAGFGMDNLPTGTLVEVRDLFGSIPARLKFLKSPASELRRAQAWLVRLALANPACGFTLSAGERQILHFSQNQDLATRLRLVWPAEIVDQLLPVDATFHNIRLTGLVAPPQMHQPRPDRIFFFVNGRAVNDKRLMSAVREAYRGRQTSRDYPQLALFVELDPAEIDINVHPAKTEVRFRNESAIFSAVSGALGRAFCFTRSFAQPAWPPSDDERTEPRPQGFWGSLDENPIMPRLEQRQPAPDRSPPNQAACAIQKSTFANIEAREQAAPAARLGEAPLNFTTAEDDSGLEPGQPLETPPTPVARYTWLAQIANTYLILTDESNALLLLDQHAAHERILFNRFRSGHETEPMPLMTPIEIRLENSQNAELAMPLLRRSGFESEKIGKILKISQIPQIFSRNEAREFLLAILNGRLDSADAVYASMACKAAIKAGQALAPNEARELTRQWQSCADAEFCPHGRPCVLRFEPYILEKMFKRR